MKPNRELTAIESALAQQVAALTSRVAELEVALAKASSTIAALKTFCDVPLTTVRAAETEIEIDAALKGAGK